MTGTAARAIFRRTLRQDRVRTGCFALLFLLVSYANTEAFSSGYPTRKDRLAFAHTFAGNGTLRLFYGLPRDLLTLGGYSAWRLGGLFSILACVRGLLAAVAVLRGEEDAGRSELVLAGAVTRGVAYGAAVAAVLLSGCWLWLGMFAGLLGAGLPADGSALLALATVGPGLVFVGVGALAAQLAASRRLAAELATAVLALALILRTLADTGSGRGWLRSLTPLGWTEQLHAFTGVRGVLLLAPFAASAAVLALAGWIARRRDVGEGLLKSSDSHPSRHRGLSSPLALEFREQRMSLVLWMTGVGAYGAIVGALSTSLNSTDIPAGLQNELRKLGALAVTTPRGALGFYFLFFVLAVSLYMCSQVAAARREEADGRLETLLAQPLGRPRWLFGRFLLALAGSLAISLTAGLATWVAAAAENAGVPLAALLEAGANCLPAALLFGGLGFLALGVLPRAATGIAYGLVAVAFVWELFGSLLQAPHWLVEATPFQHVAYVPEQPIALGAGVVMLAAGLAAAGLAVLAFARRDLIGAERPPRS